MAEQQVTSVQDRSGAASPHLSFSVIGVEVAPFATVPTLRFQLEVKRTGGGPILSISLMTAVRIAPARRRYRPEQEPLLAELFGTAQQRVTMGPLAWTRSTMVVASFTDSTVVELPVECTQDVELAVTKYFHAVGDGDVPLDFLFSGTVFHRGEGGAVRTAQISWESETTFDLPGGSWRAAIDRSSPGHRWIRVSEETWEQLYDYRRRHTLPDWNATINELRRRAEPDHGRGT